MLLMLSLELDGIRLKTRLEWTLSPLRSPETVRQRFGKDTTLKLKQ